MKIFNAHRNGLPVRTFLHELSMGFEYAPGVGEEPMPTIAIAQSETFSHLQAGL